MAHEEQEPMIQAKVKIYAEGSGPVCPTGEVSDQELIEEVEATQAEVTDEHVVCVDEREALEHQPVRYKMAGGNLTTGFAAAELADWSLYADEQRDSTPEQRVDTVADFLVAADEKLGAHVDNHADESVTNCKAADAYPLIINAVGEHGHDIEFEAQMKDVLGAHFDPEVWNATVTRSAEKAAKPELQNWSGYFIIDTVKKYGGIVEVLNGDHQNKQLDPNNERKNHWGEGVGVNTVPGHSNNRDKARIPYFQVDIPKVVEVCQKMAKDGAEFSRLLHAAAAYQIAIRYKITSGQRNVEITEKQPALV